MRGLRVALVCDLLEECWPSMDLVAEMLADRLPVVAPGLSVTMLRPRLRRRATRVPIVGRTRLAFRLDRYSNRYADYARWLRRHRDGADVFHVLDHSYAHLVHVLPPGRTLVTCHDTDAFRCLAAPGEGGWYRPFARRALAGLRRAARVTCDTQATRDDLVARGLLSGERAAVVHNGVHRAYTCPVQDAARREIDRLLGPRAGVELLHVGSVAPRKRLDVLLRVAAGVRSVRGGLRLVRAGGPMTPEQRALARSLGIGLHMVELPRLTPQALAAAYARADLTLLPSDREGFGLPLVESLSCGTPVLASRIPALVEVGGEAASYEPPGDVDAWVQRALALLDERDRDEAAWARRREAGRQRAACFTWDAYACEMARLYATLAPPFPRETA